MSIAVLIQVYDEIRRLAIAGSAVASGDFRLKKLIPPLEQAGQKAPVFAKVAQATQAVVESTDKTAAVALLELTTLVNAILYTQGATGLAGDVRPIETKTLGTLEKQASARVLKPLLVALSTSGSGRLEVIRDAVERGTFLDLRLVKPSLQSIDDHYPEIGDLIAEKVLPLYGKAILPELRAKFDMKGKAGNQRRLSLMHALDPEGTRELVKQTLEDGSKELKVVAIECLGQSDDDLGYLLEQSKARAKDVRTAALGALMKLSVADAVATVKKAVTGADLELVADRLRVSANAELVQFVLDEADKQLAKLLKLKEKKEQGAAITRMQHLLHVLDGRSDAGSEAVLLKCFARMSDLEAIKSEPSGSDLNELVARLMAHSSKPACERLIAVHETLSGPMLSHAFLAARRALPTAQLFELFGASLTAKSVKKSKKGDVLSRLAAIRDGLTDEYGDYRFSEVGETHKLPELDPRWLDVAVAAGELEVARHLARPGHAELNQLLSQQYAVLSKKKGDYESRLILETMIRIQHPEATDSVIELLQRSAKETHFGYLGYWIGRLIPDLPQEAVPKFEALLPTLPEKMVDQLMDSVSELKNSRPGSGKVGIDARVEDVKP